MQASNRIGDLLPAVLDRLLDDDPARTRDARPPSSDLGALKSSLARDLEILLNTRALPMASNRYPLAARSVLAFGTPELSGTSLRNGDERERLRARVHGAIATHERRLAQIRVAVDVAQIEGRQLRFHVDAVLRTSRYRTPICFDATLDVASSSYVVTR